MPYCKLVAAAAVSFSIATPAMAQQVMSEPAYCGQFYPYANCQNKGPGNPYTDPNYPRGPGQYEAQPGSDQTVGVTGKRSRTQRSSATRMQ
jgi:hypothetical protein